MEISDIEPSISELKKAIQDLKEILKSQAIEIRDTKFQLSLHDGDLHASKIIQDAVSKNLDTAQREGIHRDLCPIFNNPTVGSGYPRNSIQAEQARFRIGEFMDEISK